MTNDQHTQERGGPPESFMKEVKYALEHLYDFSHLQGHSLAQQYEAAPAKSAETAGHHLRRELIAAIESLNPGSGIPFRALSARRYNLLALHYVEGMTIREAGQELGKVLYEEAAKKQAAAGAQAGPAPDEAGAPQEGEVKRKGGDDVIDAEFEAKDD